MCGQVFPVVRCGRVVQTFMQTVPLVVAMVGGFANAEPAPTPDAAVRIDQPVSPSNSVLVDFGFNARLHMPKVLFPAQVIPEDAANTIRSTSISMVFQYPDMVLSSFPSGMSVIFDRLKGVPQSHSEHFPVKIVYLFYSAGDLGNLPRGRRHGVPFPEEEARPPRILQDRIDDARDFNEKAKHLTYPDPTVVDSKYDGLREVHFPIVDKNYYDRLVRQAEAEGWKYPDGSMMYIGLSDAPYELFMDCQAPDSLECRAYVYSKATHFQYQMIFPPQYVERTDKLVRKINAMIDNWSAR